MSLLARAKPIEEIKKKVANKRKSRFGPPKKSVKKPKVGGEDTVMKEVRSSKQLASKTIKKPSVITRK